MHICTQSDQSNSLSYEKASQPTRHIVSDTLSTMEQNIKDLDTVLDKLVGDVSCYRALRIDT